MFRKLWYFPLEPYKERYTVQLSAHKTGWLERNWITAGINYARIEGLPLFESRTHSDRIYVGSVLDAYGRGHWSCSQIMTFLTQMDKGEVTSDDVLYFDDFWHPGFSALPYAFHQAGIRPKMYAMLHAQSVDPFDFTYPMRHWMRHYEIGQSKVMSGIFVTSTCLMDMLLHAGVGDKSIIHICGLPFCSEEVREHFPAKLPERKRQVIYTSRWDKEKDPEFFLKVVGYIIEALEYKDIQFLITTSARNIKSNEDRLLRLLEKYLTLYPDNLTLKESLSKDQYYYNLLESKIQFNCSHQDFVSWTLLEATTCGCHPVYPYHLSFPEALNYQNAALYQKCDVPDAAQKILKWIDVPNFFETWSWVYERFDDSWQRMLNVMSGRKSYRSFPGVGEI